MASLLGFLQRNRLIFSPPAVAHKDEAALKFGILGAAKIAPMALINPAKGHADVIIQAVAARDLKKAKDYAKKHGIPEVKPTYQDLLDDPNLDCIYVALPNGLHKEWALKALKAGKHVLLEKPSVSNAAEAADLFRLPLLSGPKAPVLLEAFHYRFLPTWQFFLSTLDRPNIQHATACMYVPVGIIAQDDIRFKYELAGGGMMDLGTYPFNALRQVFGAEPEECLETKLKLMPPPYDQRCDHGFSVKWRFSNGGTAQADGDLLVPLKDVVTKGIMPKVSVTHRPTKVEDAMLSSGQEKLRTRKVTLLNFVFSASWHRIDIEDEYTVRNVASGEVVKRWKEKESKKAYTFQEAGLDGSGEIYWNSYRHQLEQFVNRVKGRETTAWVEHEDSIAQARMLDMAYEKANLPLRVS